MKGAGVVLDHCDADADVDGVVLDERGHGVAGQCARADEGAESGWEGVFVAPAGAALGCERVVVVGVLVVVIG